jgi:hypothetical protein
MVQHLKIFAALSFLSSAAYACDSSRPISHLDLFGTRLTVGFGISRPCAPPVIVAQAPAPQPVYVAQPVYVPTPQPYYVPPPTAVYVPVQVVQPAAPRPAPRDEETRGRIAFKYLGGFNSPTFFGSTSGSPSPQAGWHAHSLGVEWRMSRYFALRSDLEFRPTSRSLDLVGLKFSLFPTWAIRPYLSASLAGNYVANDVRKWSVGVVGAGGLTLHLSRNFFLETEFRVRTSPEACCRETGQLDLLVGGGFAFL